MQTSYTETMTSRVAGGVDSYCDSSIATRKLADGEDDVYFGRAVEADTSSGDGFAKIYEGGKIQGIAVRDPSETNDAADAYVGQEVFPMLSIGRVFVLIDDDVTPASAVYVRKKVLPEVFTITWDGDFVASNVINGSVDGEAIAPVTYAVSHAATLAAVAAAIQALTNVVTATATGAREITVTGAVNGDMLSGNSTFTVTLGAGQASDVIANVTGPTASGDLGVFRADADSVDVAAADTAVALPQARFLETASAGDLVLMEINLP